MTATWEQVEQILGVKLLPWQRDILDDVRAGKSRLVARTRASGYHTMLRAARLARVCDAIDDLEQHVGVTGHVGTDASCIVVSESDYEVMKEWAKSRLPITGTTSAASTLLGIPIVTAPDWTCDEAAVAWLRLRARAARPFRRLLRRLAESVTADRNA